MFRQAVLGVFIVMWWLPDAEAQLQYDWYSTCRRAGGSHELCSGGYQAPAQPTCPPGTTFCGKACCNPGYYCSNYGCTPHGAVDCGNGYCKPGTQCASNNRCIPESAIDCGTYHCDQGDICSRGGGCVPRDADDCGQGRYCKAGYKCWPRGEDTSGEDLTCITEQESNRRQLAAKAASIASAYGLKDGLLVKDFEERHKRAIEYVVHNDVVRDKLTSLLATRSTTAMYGPMGDKVSSVMLNIKATMSYMNDFNTGRYYEGSLKITNQVSSILLEALPYGGTSADVLSVAAAVATAYTYGFFWGQ